VVTADHVVRAFFGQLAYAIVVFPCREFLREPGGRFWLPVGEFDEGAEWGLFDDFGDAHESLLLG
jgi:hypothetical protein